MTASPSIDPEVFLHEELAQASPDLMRHLLESFINTLLSAQADSVCGAGYGSRTADRANRRNGYRHRDLDTRVGVLVLAGSSGRVDTQRAQLLAEHGAHALPLQWFGGPGQPPGPCEVPIETFTSALDHLAMEADFLAIVGVSFGAEAALLTASLDPRVQAFAAFAPTHVTWPGYDTDQQRWTSHWTLKGSPLPFVPLRRPAAAQPDDEPPRYLPVYQASLAAASAETPEQATIRVETIPEVLLVSGGVDRVWPSADSAHAIESRRAAHRLHTCHVHLPKAGHRTTLPGERTPNGGRLMTRGGNFEADHTRGWRRRQGELRTVRMKRPGQHGPPHFSAIRQRWAGVAS